MALLERVGTLIRANLNDLIDKAENPEKMLKQVMLDMQNQLMQVKTQVAIALADEHLLRKKQQENTAKHGEWMRKAELAVGKHDDELARAALARAMSYQQLAANFEQQAADQKVEAENLKSALRQLEQKLAEAEAKAELLITRHRRSRALTRANDARAAAADAGGGAAAFDRMKRKVDFEEALSAAKSELTSGTMEDRLAALDQQDEIERLLAELKARRGS